MHNKWKKKEKGIAPTPQVYSDSYQWNVPCAAMVSYVTWAANRAVWPWKARIEQYEKPVLRNIGNKLWDIPEITRRQVEAVRPMEP